VYVWTPEQTIKYTAQNPYERFPDGRPKVPDELLAKVKGLSTADVNLPGNGYQNQFVDTLLNLHPEKKLVGRAVTLQLAPARADVGDSSRRTGGPRGTGGQSIIRRPSIRLAGRRDCHRLVREHAGGRNHRRQSGVLHLEKDGDRVCDRRADSRPGRDFGVGHAGFFVGAEPSFIHGAMVMGIDIPVRIGSTTVMPGDVVLGDKNGVVFIPPHLVQGVLDAAAARKQ